MSHDNTGPQAPATEADIVVSIQLPLGALNYLLGLLSKQPIAEAGGLFSNLQQQAQQALAAAREPQQEKPNRKTRRKTAAKKRATKKAPEKEEV